MIQVLIPEVSEKNFPGIQEDYCSREHAALWGNRKTISAEVVLNTWDELPQEPQQWLLYTRDQ